MRDAAAVLDRVRKLLALATSPNVHEAALAAARAQELIERHRLEGLLAAEAEAEADPITDGRDEPLEVARRLRRWKGALAAGLAEANGCRAYTAEIGGKTHLLVAGRASDRAAILALWEWLVPRLEWLSATHGAGQPRDWHEAFRIGAAETIADRLRGAVSEARASLDSAALARIEPTASARAEAVERYSRETLRLRPGRSPPVNADGLVRGRIAGASVPLPGRKG